MIPERIIFVRRGITVLKTTNTNTFIVLLEQHMFYETSMVVELERLRKETVVNERRTDRQFAWMDWGRPRKFLLRIIGSRPTMKRNKSQIQISNRTIMLTSSVSYIFYHKSLTGVPHKNEYLRVSKSQSLHSRIKLSS